MHPPAKKIIVVAECGECRKVSETSHDDCCGDCCVRDVLWRIDCISPIIADGLIHGVIDLREGTERLNSSI